MTLNVNSLLCRQFLRVLTKWLKLESRDFHYKVALYHSSLLIKFDDYLFKGSDDLVFSK